MKRSILLFALGIPAALFAESDQANNKNAPAAPAAPAQLPADLPEADRAVQQYMIRREQWIKIREAAQANAKNAKTEVERKAILKKADDDERVLRAAAADDAKKAHDAQKNKVTQGRPSGG